MIKFAAVIDYDSSDIAEAREGAAQYAIVKANVGAGEPIEDVKFSLTLNAKTAVNVLVKPADGQTINEAPSGKEQINGAEYFRYRATKIGPRNLGKMKTFTFTTDAGTSTVKVCPMSYVNAILTGSSDESAVLAMTAYYNYYLAASAYQG